MKFQKLRKLIENKRVSDEDVLSAIKEFTADRYNRKGKLLLVSKNKLKEIENLRTLTAKLRPRVMEKFRQHFLIEHGENCPACQKLKASQNKK